MEETRSIGVLALRGGEDARATWWPEPRGPSGGVGLWPSVERRARSRPRPCGLVLPQRDCRHSRATPLPLVHTEQERCEGVCTGV